MPPPLPGGDVRLLLPWPSPFRTFLPCNMSHKVRLDLTHQRPRPDRHTAHWLCATRNKDIHNGRHGTYLCLRPSSGAVSGQCGEEADTQRPYEKLRFVPGVTPSYPLGEGKQQRLYQAQHSLQRNSTQDVMTTEDSISHQII